MAAIQDSGHQRELDHSGHQGELDHSSHQGESDSNPGLVVLASDKVDYQSTVVVIVPVEAELDMDWETETFHTLTEPAFPASAFLASALHCLLGMEVVLMTSHILVSKSSEQTRVEEQRSEFQWMKIVHRRLPTATEIVWNPMSDEGRNLHSGFH